MKKITNTWFSSRVLKWHALHGRHDLPWKDPITPYRVWISEIMLQQTQVSTVIPYFIRFMENFPSVEALAAAPIDWVFHHWAGLGYYARAKNLHRAANVIVKELQSQFPQTVEDWILLPGVGRSTAGAIVAQSFNQYAPILDGNVKRVLCRFHGVTGWPGEKAVEKKLWELAEYYTPHEHVADFTQAMMDLGALCCTRSKPRCAECPLQSECFAALHQKQSVLPEKKPTQALPTKKAHILVLQTRCGHWLLTQRPLKGIWSGLWTFPEFMDLRSLNHFIQATLQLKDRKLETLDLITHTFTHYHLHLLPRRVWLNKPLSRKLPPAFAWINHAMLKQRGVPAPIQKLIQKLEVV